VASIGYNFGISQVEIITIENLNQEQFGVSLSTTRRAVKDSFSLDPQIGSG
jgi:hypothetical protein